MQIGAFGKRLASALMRFASTSATYCSCDHPEHLAVSVNTTKAMLRTKAAREATLDFGPLLPRLVEFLRPCRLN